MISFEYKGIRGSEYGIYCKTVKRSLLPAIRRREFEIFGKSGIVDIGNNDYAPKIMTVSYIYRGNLVDLGVKAALRHGLIIHLGNSSLMMANNIIYIVTCIDLITSDGGETLWSLNVSLAYSYRYRE